MDLNDKHTVRLMRILIQQLKIRDLFNRVKGQRLFAIR